MLSDFRQQVQEQRLDLSQERLQPFGIVKPRAVGVVGQLGRQLAFQFGQLLDHGVHRSGVGAELFDDFEQFLKRAVGHRGGAERAGLKLDLLDPEPLATSFGGQAANLGHESLRVGLQSTVQGCRAAETHTDGQQAVRVGLGCKQAIEHLGRAARTSDSVSSSATSTRSTLPPYLVQPLEDRFDALIGMDRRQQASLGPGLANMPALYVAREHDRRLIAENLASVDMTQGPVVITSNSKFLERAGRIPLVAIHSAHAGMEQSDVGAASLGRWIGRGQVLHDSGLGEALPMDRHAQVLELHGLGAFVGQEADILGQSQGSRHLVGGVMIAGDDEDRDLQSRAAGRAP